MKPDTDTRAVDGEVTDKIDKEGAKDKAIHWRAKEEIEAMTADEHLVAVAEKKAHPIIQYPAEIPVLGFFAGVVMIPFFPIFQRLGMAPDIKTVLTDEPVSVGDHYHEIVEPVEWHDDGSPSLYRPKFEAGNSEDAG